jgi:heme/copper-type cytochrome/quinol oxidase subunit 4
MSISTKPTSPSQVQPRPLRRIWKKPRSKAQWMWLTGAVMLFVLIAFYWVHERGFDYKPGLGSLPRFGIIAFFLFLLMFTYTLRRRFMRFLPGKAQSWLWMHTWFGILVLLTVLLHANFYYVLHDYCFSIACLAPLYAGPIALYALILLVVAGIVGRLLDLWQTRVIARDANSNGVGIAQALEERIVELNYMVERLYAGKSEQFQRYCRQALSQQEALSGGVPALPAAEQAEFRRACETLARRSNLQQSLHCQNRARLIMRRWRAVHIACACLAVGGIALHLGLLALKVLSVRFHMPL